MSKIEELYREKDKLERALLVMLILPLPGIGLGLLLQIRKIEKEIRRETLKLKDQTLFVVVHDNKETTEKT